VISFDSNILVYAADREDGERHVAAGDLVERSIRRGNCPDSAVLLRIPQCGNQQIRIEAGAAAAFVDGSRAVMLVEAATPADLGEAMRAVSVHRIGFWDTILWATARRAGVRIPFSEDFQDGQMIEGVRILNPSPHITP
jgi:predicted nucleic acid-binding protein